MGTVLIDTSVIIGVLRQHANALALAEAVKGSPKAVTNTVLAEVLAGARNKREFQVLALHLGNNFKWLPTSERDSAIFRDILFKYGPQHGVHIVDYQIAAAAIANEIPLLTLNKKHVRFIEGLVLAE